jgi:hypothetical protein
VEQLLMENTAEHMLRDVHKQQAGEKVVYLFKHMRPVAHNQPPRRSEHERLRLLAGDDNEMHEGDGMDEDDDEESVRVGAKFSRATTMGKSRKKRRKVVGWADLM